MNRSHLSPLGLYILKKIFFAFIWFLFILTALLLFISFAQYSDIFITTGITLGAFISVLVIMLPLALEFAIPIAFMSSLLYVVYLMIVRNEILAVELSGMRRVAISLPILISSVLISLVNLILSMFISPISVVATKNKAIEFARKGLIDSLSVNKINDDIPDTMIFFSEKDGNQLLKLFLFQRKDSGEYSLLYANRARPQFISGGLSLRLEIEDGRVIDRNKEDLLLVDYAAGDISIDLADLIEKRIKHIRGISSVNTAKESLFQFWDSLYLSFVNIWIAIMVILIFIGRREGLSFIRYILFFLSTGLFYTGFRWYHSISENGIMGPGHSFLFVSMFIVLVLMLIKGFIYRNVRPI